MIINNNTDYWMAKQTEYVRIWMCIDNIEYVTPVRNDIEYWMFIFFTYSSKSTLFLSWNKTIIKNYVIRWL